MPRKKPFPYAVRRQSADGLITEALVLDAEVALHLAALLSSTIAEPVVVTGLGRRVIATFRNGLREQ